MRSRIIATIGPASDNVDTLAEMMQAGMNIARLNYSHGDFEGKERTIQNIREAETKSGTYIGLLAIYLVQNSAWGVSKVKSNCCGRDSLTFIVAMLKVCLHRAQPFSAKW